MKNHINNSKLMAAFKATPEKPVLYTPYGTRLTSEGYMETVAQNGAGYVSNGFFGAVITDHDDWKDLMIRLNTDAERGKVKLLESETLPETLAKRFNDPKLTHHTYSTGITVDNGHRTVELFQYDQTILALDSRYIAPFSEYVAAVATAPTAPVQFVGYGYTALVCPVMPKTFSARLKHIVSLIP